MCGAEAHHSDSASDVPSGGGHGPVGGSGTVQPASSRWIRPGVGVTRRVRGRRVAPSPDQAGRTYLALGLCGDGRAAARVLGGGARDEARGGDDKHHKTSLEEESYKHHDLGAVLCGVYQRHGGQAPRGHPELMAYLICILRVSQDFGGMAWVNYDAAFRRQAAATSNRQWSRINPSLYSICFAGSARTSTRCDLSLSLTHVTRDCPMVEDPDPGVGSRLKAIESAVLAMARPRAWTPPSMGGPPPVGALSEACRSFNNKRCNFRGCRFRHVCRVCGGPQPALDCCERARVPGMPVTGGPVRGQARAARPMFNRARDGVKPY